MEDNRERMIRENEELIELLTRRLYFTIPGMVLLNPFFALLAAFKITDILCDHMTEYERLGMAFFGLPLCFVIACIPFGIFAVLTGKTSDKIRRKKCENEKLTDELTDNEV